jgi:putative flavoprotein involved in K+ transport
MAGTARLGFPLYIEGPSVDDCDLLQRSFPYPVAKEAAKITTDELRRIDADILRRLEAIGFRLDFGEEDTGYQMSFLRRGGGYYINVGCSDLLIEGAVGLLQYADIDHFVAEGARLRDGRVVPADLVVLATGYKPQLELVRRLLGEDVAGRVGPIWGFDAQG